ncbi:MAG: hypothetical protein PHY92_02540 [Alphaproteobacteria bacterium]|nr:hypothetical protein [Alphaproteobacteria bacterium]
MPLPRPALLIVLPLLMALSACGSTTNEVKAPPSVYIQLSPISPPVAPYEVKQSPANPMTEIWRKGYWSYDGSEFHWRPGHLMPRPSHTAVWCADRWYQHEFGWGFIPGHWM